MTNPRCAICYNSFVRCIPRVLPCGHSLCSDCLLSLTEDRCPFCKGSFGDICKIPVNYSLQELVRTTAPRHDCHSCPYPPQKWCSSCHQTICSVAQEDNWHPNHPLLSFAEQAQVLEEEIERKKKGVRELLDSSQELPDSTIIGEIEALFTATKQVIAVEIAREQEARKALARQKEQILQARLEALEDLSDRLVKFTPKTLQEGHTLISADVYLPPLLIDWNSWLVIIYRQATVRLLEKIGKLSVSSKFTASPLSCTGSSTTHCGGLITNFSSFESADPSATAHCDGLMTPPETSSTSSSSSIPGSPAVQAAMSCQDDNVFFMVSSGKGEELKSILDISDIDKRIHAHTPLIIAILYQQVEIIDWLLEKGADVNKEDVGGNPPLYYVCHLRNRELQYIIADKLLRAGADIYKRNSVCSFLEFVREERTNQELNSLVDHEVVDTEKMNSSLADGSIVPESEVQEERATLGSTIFRELSKGETTRVYEEMELELENFQVSSSAIIQMQKILKNSRVRALRNHRAAQQALELINKNTPVNSPDFFKAIKEKDTSRVLQWLLAGNPSEQNERGEFPLSLANGDIETIRILLDLEAYPDLNLVPNHEYFCPTLLMIAAKKGDIESAKLLLEYGADPRRKDLDGSLRSSREEVSAITPVVTEERRAEIILTQIKCIYLVDIFHLEQLVEVIFFVLCWLRHVENFLNRLVVPEDLRQPLTIVLFQNTTILISRGVNNGDEVCRVAKKSSILLLPQIVSVDLLDRISER